MSSDGLKGGVSPYALSKWELTGFTEYIADILKPYDIEVWGIAPGPTATPMMGFQKGQTLYREDLPVRKVGFPEEIAQMCVFVVSGMASTVADRIMRCDGGCV